MFNSKKQIYRYNAETDNFERIFPTVWSGLLTFGKYFIFSLLIGSVIFLIAWYTVDTPGEKRLRYENIKLKQQYDILNRRLDNSMKVMDAIRNRDDNFYRVLLQMDPVEDTKRNAGLNNEKRYRQLAGLSDGGLIKLLTQRVDLLERQLYAQSQSFDRLKAEALNRQGKMASIPSILPVGEGGQNIAGGYGQRRDPVSDRTVFHTGIDFIVSQGSSVYATADGVVKTTERRRNHGNIVVIDHQNDYTTHYYHLLESSVEAGDKIKKGDVIGTVGNSGKSLGPHLHYEVRLRDESQNPINYFFSDLNAAQYSEISIKAENAGNIMD